MREKLSAAHTSRVEFQLEFLSGLMLRQDMVLSLRRELLGVARTMGADLAAFLDPAAPDDPYARRLFQAPAPPFVIEAPERDEYPLEAGDQFNLTVNFFGNHAANICRFARLLQAVGEKGICKGEGRFELDMIIGRDQAGNQQLLWRGGLLQPDISAPLINLLWLVDECSVGPADEVVLRFRSPARLLSNRKPLFSPTLATVFPFILRRVTSMLYFWCGIELTDDAALLLNAVAERQADCSGLRWQDWRHLQGETNQIDLGGLMGEMIIDAGLPEDLWTVLRLGELFHVGKGAAYGAGRFTVSTGLSSYSRAFSCTAAMSEYN